jgi:hypothetical protein
MSKYVYVLRACREDMSALYFPRFKWPREGTVKPEKWKSDDQCGNGLHGFLWGKGSPEYMWECLIDDQLLYEDTLGNKTNYEGLIDTRVFLVVKVLAQDVIEIDRGTKVKFKEGDVVYAGSFDGAVTYIAQKSNTPRETFGYTEIVHDSKYNVEDGCDLNSHVFEDVYGNAFSVINNSSYIRNIELGAHGQFVSLRSKLQLKARYRNSIIVGGKSFRFETGGVSRVITTCSESFGNVGWRCKIISGGKISLDAGYSNDLIVGYDSKISMGGSSNIIAEGNSDIECKGHSSIICSGNSSVRSEYPENVISDDCSNITLGNSANIVAKSQMMIECLDNARIISGEASNIYVGDYSYVIVGYNSFVRVGTASTVFAGHDSKVSAGKNSRVCIKFTRPEFNTTTWEVYMENSETFTYVVDGEKIKENVTYKVNDTFDGLVECDGSDPGIPSN